MALPTIPGEPAQGPPRRRRGPAPRDASPHPGHDLRWSGRTRGGYFGNWFFVQLIRLFGLRPAYAWLVVVAAYFTLASPRAYRCSVDFLRRVLGPQPFWKWPALVYRHFLAIGVTLLDRVAVVSGRAEMQFQCDGEAAFREILDRGQGMILLGSHVGGWEIGGHLLGRDGFTVNLVVIEREEARLRQLFDRALDGKRFKILTADEHPLRSISIVTALRRGEIVALHGDRAFGGEEVAVPFLGGTARFPTGPYRLAAISGAPIVQVFAVREHLGHYRFFAFPATSVRRDLLHAPVEAMRVHVAQYAERLASVARQYPFQWQNLYPFWDATSDGAALAPDARIAGAEGKPPGHP